MAASKDEKARKRAEVILKVRGERLNASQGAAELGVSRKTFYEWESRALTAMMDALADKDAGRPAAPVDAEKEALKERLAQIERELVLLKQSQYVREVAQRYHALLEAKAESAKKKRRSGQKPQKP